jgi:hypothetical protein
MAEDTSTQLLRNLGFALKELYFPRMLEIVKAELFWFRLLKKRTATLGMEGKTMKVPIQDTWVESFRATTEDGVVARPTILSGFVAEIPKRIHTATIQFSNITDQMTRAARASYIRTKTALMDATASGFSKKMSEVFMGYGRGVLARVNGAPTTAAGVHTITVDDELSANSGMTFGLKWLRKHMRLQASVNKTVGDYSLERGADIQVLSIDTSNLRFTAKGPLGALADNDYLYWEGSKNIVSDGLIGILDDGTVQNLIYTVNRTTNPEYQSYVRSSIAGANLESVIMRMANQIRSKVGMNQLKKGSGWVLLTTPGVAQQYFEQMSVDRRIQMQAIKGRSPVFEGGTESFWVTSPVTGPMQMVTDLDVPTGYMFLFWFSKDIWYLSQLRGPGWYDVGGVLKPVRGTYLVEATYGWPVELVDVRPDLGAKGTGITEAV